MTKRLGGDINPFGHFEGIFNTNTLNYYFFLNTMRKYI